MSGFTNLTATVRGLGAAAAESKKDVDALADAADKAKGKDLSALFDLTQTLDVSGFLTRSDQSGRAKDIESGPFGAYLDDIARIEAYLASRSDNSAAEIFKRGRLEETLRTFQDIVRRFAGAAGRQFSFEDLRAEIQKLVRAQEAAERSSRRTSRGGASGTLGSGGTASGSAGLSLSVLRAAGDVR